MLDGADSPAGGRYRETKVIPFALKDLAKKVDV